VTGHRATLMATVVTKPSIPITIPGFLEIQLRSGTKI
jgi:hypothetical protein